MKKIIQLFLLTVFAIIVFVTCKKEPETPGGNKIEIGLTTIDSVEYVTANVSSTVNDLGGNEIIQHGHCWSKDKEPTIESSKTELGKLEAAGSFNSVLAGLEDNTAYYVRSYLKYSNGVVYGTELTIKTLKTGVPVVSTGEVGNITLNTAQCGGEAMADSGLIVTVKGVCWDTTAIFTIANCMGKTNEGDSLGSYVSELTGLNEGQTYFVKAYATNAKGTGYGDVKMFSTIPITLPVVNTTAPTEISAISALSGGNVIADGNSTITARGICWGITADPTLENSTGHTISGGGLGSFADTLTGLAENTMYYVRAYATNEKGVGYGEAEHLTTLEISLPIVMTNEVSNISRTTATCGGVVIYDGAVQLTVRGVCWSTGNNPTINDSHTTDGNGIGNFVSYLTGLSENTTYYVRAYATNSAGTAYGEEEAFITWQCGDQITYEGQVYNTVEIGTQCWFKENLNVGIRINGYQAQTDNGQVEKYCYENFDINCNTYGGLYQWDELMQYTASQGMQGICPEGWHVPTDDDWKSMEMELGMSQGEVNDIGYRGTDEGKKLKSTYGWFNNGNGTNSSGFFARPGGLLSNSGSYNYLEYYGSFWSSTETADTNAWSRYLYYDNNKVYRGSLSKTYAFSLRCLKD